jgi:hypothetical protein
VPAQLAYIQFDPSVPHCVNPAFADGDSEKSHPVPSDPCPLQSAGAPSGLFTAPTPQSVYDDAPEHQ